MFEHSRSWILLLTAALVVVSNSIVPAAEEPWETLPNGVLGQRAEFEGNGGAKIAGYVRKPPGAGPFPLVIFVHGGGPTAKPVQAANDDDLAKLRAAEATRASDVLGRA